MNGRLPFTNSAPARVGFNLAGLENAEKRDTNKQAMKMQASPHTKSRFASNAMLDLAGEAKRDVRRAFVAPVSRDSSGIAKRLMMQRISEQSHTQQFDAAGSPCNMQKRAVAVQKGAPTPPQIRRARMRELSANKPETHVAPRPSLGYNINSVTDLYRILLSSPCLCRMDRLSETELDSDADWLNLPLLTTRRGDLEAVQQSLSVGLLLEACYDFLSALFGSMLGSNRVGRPGKAAEGKNSANYTMFEAHLVKTVRSGEWTKLRLQSADGAQFSSNWARSGDIIFLFENRDAAALLHKDQSAVVFHRSRGALDSMGGRMAGGCLGVCYSTSGNDLNEGTSSSGWQGQSNRPAAPNTPWNRKRTACIQFLIASRDRPFGYDPSGVTSEVTKPSELSKARSSGPMQDADGDIDMEADIWEDEVTGEPNKYQTVYCVVIHSVTSVEREWQAIASMNISQGVCNSWYSAHAVVPRGLGGSKLEGPFLPGLHRPHVLDAAKTLNEIQGSVLRNILHEGLDSTILVQGPPGTGKSSVIAHVLHLVLHSKPPWKVLVASPSNAAVDNLVEKMWNLGFRGPTMLRVGSNSALPDDILQSVSLFTAQRSEVSAAVSTIKSKHSQMVSDLKAQIAECGKQIDDFMQKGQKTQARQVVVYRDRLRSSVVEVNKAQQAALNAVSDTTAASRIAKAYVIFGTLNAFGSVSVTRNVPAGSVEILLVDEACQSSETSTLIPIVHYNPKRVVLVGDPRQLPPTLLNRRSKLVAADVSLFERLELEGFRSTMLETQYRMHPSIVEFPNMEFYDQRLQTDLSVLQRAPLEDSISPVSFFSVEPLPGTPVTPGGKGVMFANHREMKVICRIVGEIASRPNIDSLSIRVISPYKHQVGLLSYNLLSQRVLVSTVDGVQGRESDVVILSLVRSSYNSFGNSVGFLSDVRRINVALTRAKRALIIVGDATHLESSSAPVLSNLVRHCRSRGFLVPLHAKADEGGPIPLSNGDKIEYFKRFGLTQCLPAALASQGPTRSRLIHSADRMDLVPH